MDHREERFSGTHIFTELNELNEYSVTRLGSFYTEFESSRVKLQATRLAQEF
jgi:hypothetical protein